ncbi:hypothetical protein [Edaphobacter aggregans]|uniref:hypothetical protein n=1 Tax=Edaphobacter aggregans TaxID=570835 RepID=UPI0005511B18|nr:hypothetical protein [Edaphobacter aggregans]
MRLTLRPFVLVVLLALCSPLYPAPIDKSLLLDEQALIQLEQRAQQANPREQCFLYTELVSAMTEIAGKEMLNGDPDRATAMFKKIQHYAELIQLNLARDTKRLKNAEMLMHRTTYRLNEYLHSASSEDRPTLQATLKQLNKVQNDLLTQVFNH